MPRFSANLTFLFTEVDFPARFGAAADAGFHAVEFAYPYAFDAAMLAQQVREHGLDVVLFNAPPGDHAAGDRGLASVPGRENEFAASIDTALRYAQALQCPRLHVMAGNIPVDADAHERERRRKLYLRHLRWACAQAATLGVTILVEPLNAGDAPNYLLSHQADAHALLAEVAAPNLQMQFDLYHAQITEGNLARKLKHFLPHIGHIQIAGVPDRHEPDTGEINYPWLFEQLDEWGYDGWIGCEYRPAHGTLAGLAWLRPWLAADRSPRTTRRP